MPQELQPYFPAHTPNLSPDAPEAACEVALEEAADRSLVAMGAKARQFEPLMNEDAEVAVVHGFMQQLTKQARCCRRAGAFALHVWSV